MEKVIIPLVIILVIVGVIAGVVFYVKNKVRKFSQDLFGTDSLDRKSTRLNSSHVSESRMPSSA